MDDKMKTDSKIYALLQELDRDALLAITDFQGDTWKYQSLETEDLRCHILGAYRRGDLLAFEVLEATGYWS